MKQHIDLYVVVKNRMHGAVISCHHEVVRHRVPLPFDLNNMTIEHLHFSWLTGSSSAVIVLASMAIESEAFALSRKGNWNYGII
jgi:hypothetical protein